MDDSKKDPKIFDIAGQRFKSRLLIGTGKYKDFKQTKSAIDASGAEIVTVAIRRINIGQDKDKPSLLDYLPAKDYTYLPNTAGCYTAEDAVRTLRLARELLDGHKLVKLEVLGDSETLYPNIVETINAAKILIKDGFDVMVYTSDDPIVAKQLEDIGCCAIMPLASLIGSGMGILNPWNLEIIIDRLSVPVIVDAGIDPVWFGIFAVIVVEFGLISPPVGMNLFVIKGVMQNTPLQTIWFGTVPFLITDVIRLALIIAFPAICLYLPSLMTP